MKIVVELEKTAAGWDAYGQQDELRVNSSGDTRELTIRLFADALLRHLDLMREGG
jgi:hypothetical protein